MGLQSLIILFAILIGILGAGVIYLLWLRLKRRKGRARSTQELIDEIESRPLSDKQKAELAEAIKKAKRYP